MRTSLAARLLGAPILVPRVLSEQAGPLLTFASAMLQRRRVFWTPAAAAALPQAKKLMSDIIKRNQFPGSGQRPRWTILGTQEDWVKEKAAAVRSRRSPLVICIAASVDECNRMADLLHAEGPVQKSSSAAHHIFTFAAFMMSSFVTVQLQASTGCK